MKLAINGQMLAATHPLPQLLDVLEQFEINAIELWPSNLPGGGTREEEERYEKRDVRGTAKVLRERGFNVACVTLGFWAAPICFGAGGVPRFTQALKGAVDAAAELGAGLVNTYNVGIPLTLWGDAVAPAAAYAAERGIVITLENEAHDESGLPQNVASVCKRVNSPGFGTQFDPCNYYHAGIEPFPNAYEIIQPFVRYVHLKGGVLYNPTLQGVHQGSTMRNSERDYIGYVPLAEAAFNVEAIVRRLNRDGYDGYITLEPHVKGEHILDFYRQEVPYLRRLMAQCPA